MKSFTRSVDVDYGNTIMLVADDPNILMMGRAAVTGSRRVLSAWNAETALWIVRRWNVDATVIRSGMPGAKLLERECRRLGMRVEFMDAQVDEGFVRFTLPHAVQAQGVMGGLAVA